MIPLATTTISVLRLKQADLYDEPYSTVEPAGRDVVASGIRAVIDRAGGRGRGREQDSVGEQSIADIDLACDPVGLTYLDLVKDEVTNRIYNVVYTLTYADDHDEAVIRIVEGET